MLTKRELATCEGQQGSWLVKVTINGRTEKLPTAHKFFVRQGMVGMVYDRDADWLQFQEAKAEKWLALLKQTKKVVLTEDTVSAGGDDYHFTRKGYIAVYAVDEIVLTKDKFHFRFLERIAEAVK
jgi:hypothetical protein